MRKEGRLQITGPNINIPKKQLRAQWPAILDTLAPQDVKAHIFVDNPDSYIACAAKIILTKAKVGAPAQLATTMPVTHIVEMGCTRDLNTSVMLGFWPTVSAWTEDHVGASHLQGFYIWHLSCTLNAHLMHS